MKYLTISYVTIFPNPDAKPFVANHVLLATPDGHKFYHPEGGPSYFTLEKYEVHENHGDLHPGRDRKIVERLVVANCRAYHRPRRDTQPCAGWLSPDGYFYPCEPWEHDSLAETICRAELRVLKGASYLEGQSWLRIYDDGLVARGWGGARQLTQRQRDTLWDLYQMSDGEYQEQIGNSIGIDT